MNSITQTRVERVPPRRAEITPENVLENESRVAFNIDNAKLVRAWDKEISNICGQWWFYANIKLITSTRLHQKENQNSIMNIDEIKLESRLRWENWGEFNKINISSELVLDVCCVDDELGKWKITWNQNVYDAERNECLVSR